MCLGHKCDPLPNPLPLSSAGDHSPRCLQSSRPSQVAAAQRHNPLCCLGRNLQLTEGTLWPRDRVAPKTFAPVPLNGHLESSSFIWEPLLCSCSHSHLTLTVSSPLQRHMSSTMPTLSHPRRRSRGLRLKSEATQTAETQQVDNRVFHLQVDPDSALTAHTQKSSAEVFLPVNGVFTRDYAVYTSPS